MVVAATRWLCALKGLAVNEKRAIRYPVDDEVIARASDICAKGMICLEHGPACRVGAVLNKNILIVDCKANDVNCPFYKLYETPVGKESHGPCCCPVRHALRKQYGL